METRQLSGRDIEESLKRSCLLRTGPNVCDKCVELSLKLPDGEYYTATLGNLLRNSYAPVALQNTLYLAALFIPAFCPIHTG